MQKLIHQKKKDLEEKTHSFKNPTFTYESADVFESMRSSEAEEDEDRHRRNTRRRLLIIVLSSAVLLFLVIGAVVIPTRAKMSSASISAAEQKSIEATCNVTLHKESCFNSIYSLKKSTKTLDSGPDSSMQIFMLSLQVTMNELMALKPSISERIGSNACSRLVQDSIDHVNASLLHVYRDNLQQFEENRAMDVRTWLSTAITDQQTCLDGLRESGSVSLSTQREVASSMANAAVFTSNSLAIASNVPGVVGGGRVISVHRKEEGKPRPNATVAKDGSGDYETIGEAVKAVPKKSRARFSIYVKRGEYRENVVVGKDCWNVMMYGDGMAETVVSSDLNYADGVGTYDSGTLIAEGRGFVAKDMGFRNTAGPTKFQAVAVRSSSDRSVFYRCHIDGYQDTLYVHSNRQFYRDCTITGTIDFIFGNAAAVFQNCTIMPKEPMKGQYNTITAQSKSDPNQNTGFSIQRCRIGPLANLTARTYFGRPWKVYSTAVVLKTEVGGIIDPEGWSVWEPASEAPDSIFYAEYDNNGPGSSLSGRVTWAGYRPEILDEEAEKFSVQEFIQGNLWLHGLNISYDPHV